MLFNSYIFIFLYLPLVLFGFFLLAKLGKVPATGWLALASIVFYGYWDLQYVNLLLASIICNYSFGLCLSRANRRQKLLLILAIAANLALLGYYKYANFFINTINQISDSHYNLHNIILPLGISFFTFTQIAFLVDVANGKVKEYNFLHYLLFVTYFPHLIAGPILHHKDIMPQFAKNEIYHFQWSNIASGLTLFIIGLFKKVILADGVAIYVSPVFNAPYVETLSFISAWKAALCYTLQIYFDFSGYSDMAIGLSLMFGIVLPLNFYSPYKSSNIIEFWRRWHMTLSHFLRDYLYVPLGGNRKGKARRYLNLMITMLLGGMWHGASWTFIIWGGLHGLYLIINHSWRVMQIKFISRTYGIIFHGLSVMLTFMAVTVAWVFFRADNLENAGTILKAMAGYNGIVLGEFAGIDSIWIAILLIIIFFVPNSWEFVMGADKQFSPKHSSKILANTQNHLILIRHLSMTLRSLRSAETLLSAALPIPIRKRISIIAIAIGLLFSLALGKMVSTQPSAFLYWNF